MWITEQGVTGGRLQKSNRSKLDIRKYFFSERVINRWNKLSQDDVDQTTANNGCSVKMDFFMDQCPPSPYGHIYFL